MVHNTTASENEQRPEAVAGTVLGPVTKKRIVTHLRNQPEQFMHNWAICGNASVLFGGPLTYTEGAVTCKACLRIMARRTGKSAAPLSDGPAGQGKDGDAVPRSASARSEGMNPNPSTRDLMEGR